VHLSPNSYDLHSNLSVSIRLHHYPYYAHVMYCNYQFSTQNMYSCPYYLISDEDLIRLNIMIEIMNEQYANLENYL